MNVVRLLIGRILLSVLTLILVSIIIFAIIEVLPGDVASRILGRDATPESLALFREKLHLNDPAVVRYFHWLTGILQGDFGNALTSSRPITQILAPRLFNSVLPSIYAFVIYVPLALIRTRHGTAIDLRCLIGGVDSVGKVCAYPGFGRLLVDSLQLRDIPLIEATVVIAAAVYVGANLLADLGAILLNPRLRPG